MNLIESEIARLIISETQDSPTLIMLREKSGQRTVTIGIHIVEAIAINRTLSNESFPRPMTHDLLQSVIEALGAKVFRVVVNDLRMNTAGQGTFYGFIGLRTADGREIEVDSRPSDALALAVRTRCPIFVAEHVFESGAGKGE
jgi:uncharacterized protein